MSGYFKCSKCLQLFNPTFGTDSICPACRFGITPNRPMNNQRKSEVTPMNPPARLCCGQPHSGPICNDGKVMCCLCFQRFSQDELSATSGQKEDVCLACAEREKAKLKEKEVMPVPEGHNTIKPLPSPETAQAGVGAEDRQITTAARGLVQRFENQCDADLSLADIMWLISEVRTAITTALAKQQEKVKYAIAFEVCSDPLFGSFIANTKLPYLVPAGMEKHACNVLSRRRNKVFIADKETLLANGCDLREEDFADPIQLPESKPDNDDYADVNAALKEEKPSTVKDSLTTQPDEMATRCKHVWIGNVCTNCGIAYHINQERENNALRKRVEELAKRIDCQ